MPGRTALLTTHYMAEADELCDRVAIVDRGRILALGTPAELKRRVQKESIFRIEVDHLPGGTTALARLPGVRSATLSATGADGGADGVAVSLALADDGALAGVVAALASAGVACAGWPSRADAGGCLRGAGPAAAWPRTTTAVVAAGAAS